MVRDEVRIKEDDSPKEKSRKKHWIWEFALGRGGLCFVIVGSI